MKCRTSFLRKVVIFLDDLHGEVRDYAGFVLDPPVPRENMLMEGIVPGWLGESQKMLMESAGLLHPFLGDFAVWDSVRKTASLTFTSRSQAAQHWVQAAAGRPDGASLKKF